MALALNPDRRLSSSFLHGFAGSLTLGETGRWNVVSFQELWITQKAYCRKSIKNTENIFEPWCESNLRPPDSIYWCSDADRLIKVVDQWRVDVNIVSAALRSLNQVWPIHYGQTEWRNKWSKGTILPNDGINMQRWSILTLAKLEGERKLWHHGLPEDGVDALASPLSVIFKIAIGQQNMIPAKWKKAKVTPPLVCYESLPWFKNYFFGNKAVHVHWFSIFWRACRYFWSAAGVHPRTSFVHCIDQWPTTLCKTLFS